MNSSTKILTAVLVVIAIVHVSVLISLIKIRDTSKELLDALNKNAVTAAIAPAGEDNYKIFQEDAELSEQQYLDFEAAAKKKWFEEHPPVKELFDPSKRELEYTISYLRKYWYHGDCALAWHQDLPCWEVGGDSLSFPVSRTENYEN